MEIRILCWEGWCLSEARDLDLSYWTGGQIGDADFMLGRFVPPRDTGYGLVPSHGGERPSSRKVRVPVVKVGAARWRGWSVFR